MQKIRQTGKSRLFLSESHSSSCFTELRANSEEVGVREHDSFIVQEEEVS